MAVKVTIKRNEEGCARHDILVTKGDTCYAVYITDEVREDPDIMFKCLASFFEEVMNGEE